MQYIQPEEVFPSPAMLLIERVFSDYNVHPFDQVEWEKRTAEISGDAGNVVFNQPNVEVPAKWSDLAVKVVVSKYFYGELGTDKRETSVKQLISRVCSAIAKEGVTQGYFDGATAKVFEDELTWLCVNQYAAFNSPVWFNVGLWEKYGVGADSAKGGFWYDEKAGDTQRCETQYGKPQCSACFIQRVEDNMESIMQLAVNEAMLFKFGSGTGTDLSSIRSSREKLSGGGKPSGPMSFLRIYDQVANVVKSGGKTRRAAKMNTLKYTHGDIEEFITAKMEEEKKAWALIEQGYDGNFNGPAYGSVMFQNENLSVRVDSEFMQKATGADKDGPEFFTLAVTDRRPLDKKNASTLLTKIAEGTWTCGDPGIQFDDAIQNWHTCKGSGRINSTNPCSEFVFLDDTACNLASINLMKFRMDSGFDYTRFKAAVRLVIMAQDILVDMSSYPTADIALNSHNFRPLGLGFANLGALLMSWGMPYDSDVGRKVAAELTAVMTGTAYAQSATIAGVKGAFSSYKTNMHSMQAVILQHSQAVKMGPAATLNAVSAWEEAYQLGMTYGYRNAQVTVLAPTGTIAFLMDCDTTGIEPDIALVKHKTLAGGGSLKITNSTVGLALQTLGYNRELQTAIVDYLISNETVENIDGVAVSPLLPNHLPVFDCAFRPAKGKRSIPYMAHLKMMAAVQPFISGAISKTVNMPNTATVEEIRNVYVEAWMMGLKCVAVYRDGSKRSQPLNTSKNSSTNEPKLHRTRMPETRRAVTHKFEIAGHEGYLTVGFFDDGTPGELFVQMAKEGSTIGGLMDTIGTLTSIALQYGVPMDTLIEKFQFQRFEPSGYTKNKDIRQATSVIDYVFRWLKISSLFDSTAKPIQTAPTPVTQVKPEVISALSASIAHFQQDAPACSKCGYIVVRSGSCYKCHNCGDSLGCS